LKFTDPTRVSRGEVIKGLKQNSYVFHKNTGHGTIYKHSERPNITIPFGTDFAVEFVTLGILVDTGLVWDELFPPEEE